MKQVALCLAVLFAAICSAVPTNDKVLVFGLKQQNLDRLQQTLLSVSEPSSPQYGKYAVIICLFFFFLLDCELISTFPPTLLCPRQAFNLRTSP